MNRKLFAGLTLIEVLISTALMAILSMAAIPSMKNFVQYWQMHTTTQTIKQSFYRMKSLSTRQRQSILLCGTQDQKTCSKDWSQGFMQFADFNQNRKRDGDEPLLELHTPFNKHHRAGRLFSTANGSYYRTWTRGSLASQPGSIWYCPPDGFEQYTRRIVISRIGRVRMETPQELKCPEPA